MSQLDFLNSPTPTPASKSGDAYKTISEVSEELDIPQHVLRFWESHFPQIKPSRMRGSRRYYRPEDIEILKRIKILLYSQGYTIKGAKKMVGKKNTPQQLPSSSITSTAAIVADAREISDVSPIPEVISELRALKNILASAL